MSAKTISKKQKKIRRGEEVPTKKVVDKIKGKNEKKKKNGNLLQTAKGRYGWGHYPGWLP